MSNARDHLTPYIFETCLCIIAISSSARRVPAVGQVNIPLLGPPIVPSIYGARYAHGLFRRGDTQMYVSRGIGLIYPPVRFNCPPEIAVLQLQRA
jgi:hypothetical protein